MSSVNEIYDYIDGFAPFSTQAEWDNSGLLICCHRGEIHKVLVTLDVTDNVVSEAVSGSFDLIVSHHPVIFKPISTLAVGDIAYRCIENRISVISAHTNYDFAQCGVNAVLAEKLSLESVACEENDFFRLGKTGKQYSCADFANFVKERLQANIRYIPIDKMIQTVAVSGGAGSEFFRQAKACGADAFVTGDASYHTFLDAASAGICLIAAGHYETEIPAVYKLEKILAERFTEIEFSVSKERSQIIAL